jgi:acetyltransferase-like isoleucine patch superfamily enzyme
MLARYGFLGVIKLFISLIYTRVCFPKSRLIRLPFDIRNKKYIKIGEGFTSGFGCRLEAHPISDKLKSCLIIGKDVEINDYVHIAAGEKVEIGNDVLIASKVFISDLNHGNYTGSKPNKRGILTKPVKILDRVWIGENVCIMSGVTIGAGAIIGAGSVVTKDIPDNSIAVGNPCRVIKIFSREKKMWIKVTSSL